MSDIHIMLAEDGGVGFAGVNYSSVHLWSRGIDSEGVAGWALLRTIDMDRFTLSGAPTGDMFLWSSAVAFERDSDELFLQAEGGIFMINISSMQLRKVFEARLFIPMQASTIEVLFYKDCLPYMCICGYMDC